MKIKHFRTCKIAHSSHLEAGTTHNTMSRDADILPPIEGKHKRRGKRGIDA